MTDLKITPLDFARRVVAALEQQAEGTPQQIEALRAELDKVRHQLHNAGNAAIWSAGVLRGEPVPPRSPGVPISLLETAASEARTKITEQAREINSRDNQIDQMAADIAKLTSRASIAEAASREKDKKLTVLESATGRAVAILNGDPCPPPLFGEPLSHIEEAALSAKGAARRADEIGRVQRDLSEARAELAKAHDRIHQLEQTHDQQVGALTAARNNVDAFQRDLARTQGDTSQAIQMLQGKRSATLTTNEVGAMLLREVSAVMRALEANSVTIRNLQEDHLVKNVGAERLRERLTEANDTIAKQADVIKELHKQYHELESRKQGVQYDLDRAKEEIEFAEAEIAKYKPLIEAVRFGIVYGYWGKWVPINSVTVADVNDGTAVSLFIPNSEDPQCL